MGVGPISTPNGLRVVQAGIRVGDIVRLKRIEDNLHNGIQICQNPPPGQVFVCLVLGTEPKLYPGPGQAVDAFDQVQEIVLGMKRERGD